MIQTIRKKLKSEDGASLMLALLFFVICAMVASVILAAATAAAGRISKLEETNQDRLALESAAGVIKNELVGVKYISTQNYKADGTLDVNRDITWQRRDASISDFSFAYVIKALVQGNTLSKYSITATESDGSTVNDIPTIKMAPSIIGSEEDKYSIKIVLTVVDAKSGKEKPLEMVLTLPADHQEHDEVINGQKSHIEEITWHTCVAVLNDGEYK